MDIGVNAYKFNKNCLVTFIAEFQAVSHGILILFEERVHYIPVVFTF